MGLYRSCHDASKALLFFEFASLEALTDTNDWPAPFAECLDMTEIEENFWEAIEPEFGPENA